MVLGHDAKMRIKAGEALGVDNLLTKAKAKEEIFLEHEKYDAADLLTIYLKRVFSLAGSVHATMPLARMTICVDRVSVSYMELFSAVMVKLGFETEKLFTCRSTGEFLLLCTEPAAGDFFT